MTDPGALLSMSSGVESQHCNKNALTDTLGWFLQALLAGLGFTCLVLKRFCEPRYVRRPWLIWFYDTSKQGMGALFIHVANLYLSSHFQGDPCTWYIINFLLDSSVGLFIIYIGIKLAQYLARSKGWEAINFGEYGKPPSATAWLAQCALYVVLMIVVKICITLLLQFQFWDQVRIILLSPLVSPQIEVAFVLLIIPFFANALMFWVTDNFLMRKRNQKNSTIMSKAKVKYQRIRKSRQEAEELDYLVSGSGDEQLLGSESLSHRQNGLNVI